MHIRELTQWTENYISLTESSAGNSWVLSYFDDTIYINRNQAATIIRLLSAALETVPEVDTEKDCGDCGDCDTCDEPEEDDSYCYCTRTSYNCEDNFCRECGEPLV